MNNLKNEIKSIVEAEYPVLAKNKYHISAVLGDGRLIHKAIYADKIADAIDEFMNGDDIPEDFNRSVSFSIVKYPVKNEL